MNALTSAQTETGSRRKGVLLRRLQSANQLSDATRATAIAIDELESDSRVCAGGHFALQRNRYRTTWQQDIHHHIFSDFRKLVIAA